jgi:hypothetical protein
MALPAGTDCRGPSSIRLWSTTTASRRQKSGRSRHPERGSAPSATICGRSGPWPRSNRRGHTRSSPKAVAGTPVRLRQSGFGSAGSRPSRVSGGNRLRSRWPRAGRHPRNAARCEPLQGATSGYWAAEGPAGDPGRPADLRICGSAGHVQDRVRVLRLGLQDPDGFTGGDS